MILRGFSGGWTVNDHNDLLTPSSDCDPGAHETVSTNRKVCDKFSWEVRPRRALAGAPSGYKSVVL